MFFEKGATKKHRFFIFLKGGYLVIGGPIDMNFGVFLETPVDLLKSVVLQLFPKYIAKVMSIWMSKVGQNSTAFKK